VGGLTRSALRGITLLLRKEGNGVVEIDFLIPFCCAKGVFGWWILIFFTLFAQQRGAANAVKPG
jgi:hypothetical protein